MAALDAFFQIQEVEEKPYWIESVQDECVQQRIAAFFLPREPHAGYHFKGMTTFQRFGDGVPFAIGRHESKLAQTARRTRTHHTRWR